MYQANVYRIMIGCPSDITDEKDTAYRVLNNWNNLNSEKDRVVLLPIHWSISSYPAMGKHPQKLLNEQVVEKSDLLVCIFGTRLGSPTDTEISGTVEEIKEHRKAGKDVMVFFKQSVDNITSVNLQQLQDLNYFKESIKNDTLWCEFSDTADFGKKFADSLQLYVSEHWMQEANSIIMESHSKKVSFDENEKQVLKRWTQGNNPYFSRLGILGGCLYVFGGISYEVSEGREQAEWDDFILRLQQADYIRLDRYDNNGKPVYKLTMAAYDYVDTITEKES